MPADSEEYGNEGRGEEPPSLHSPAKEEAEQEEEDRDGSHIHRPGSKRLRAPVHREGLGNVLEIALAVLP